MESQHRIALAIAGVAVVLFIDGCSKKAPEPQIPPSIKVVAESVNARSRRYVVLCESDSLEAIRKFVKVYKEEYSEQVLKIHFWDDPNLVPDFLPGNKLWSEEAAEAMLASYSRNTASGRDRLLWKSQDVGTNP